MEDKRRNIRRHIKAARDWLQQADKSIELKEDLQGDLKLMLAKAELKNAEKHQNQTKLIKFLSFIAAAAIAFGVFWINDDSKNLSTPAPALINNENLEILNSKPEVQNIELDMQNSKLAEVAKIDNEPLNDILIPDSAPEVEEEILSMSDSEYEIQNEELIKDEEATINEIQTDEPSESANINYEMKSEEPQNYNVELQKTPTEDMQKLMQSAGQILRAE